MAQTFDSLIRQPRQPAIRKSRGGIISEPAPWLEPSPFSDVVLDGVKRRLRSQQRPQYQGVRTLDRRPEFVDLVIGQSRGLDVAKESAFDDWQSDDLTKIVDDFFNVLDQL